MPEVPSLTYAIGLPPKDAIAYFESKGYAITFNWHDLWQEAHAKAFTVAGVARLDVLEDIGKALTDHLKVGKGEYWFRKELEPVLRKKGWWGKRTEIGADGKPRVVRMGSPARLRLIFRQNIQTAYMAGRYRQMHENAEARPFWQYVAVLDSKTRPGHKMLHGRVFRHDDAFWNSHYPPNGWGCRCRVRALSPYRMEKEGLTAESGAKHMVTRQHDITDRHTGEVITRPVTGYRMPGAAGAVSWTDPGFSYNPGAAGLANILGEGIRKLESAAYPVAAATVRSLAQGDAFAAWQAKPEGDFPLAVLRGEDAARIGGKATVARLSPETYAKQLRHHPELTQADYARAQDVVEQGERLQDGAKNLVYLLDEPGGHVVVVKATQEGDELFVTSVRRLSQGEARRNSEVRRLRKKQPDSDI